MHASYTWCFLVFLIPMQISLVLGRFLFLEVDQSKWTTVSLNQWWRMRFSQIIVAIRTC